MPHILVVDDSPPIALLLQEMLTLIGHTAEAAYGGEQALEKIKDRSPDLILLDIMMPGMSGWQVYEKIRAFSPVPIIFITASDTAANYNRAAQLGELLISKEVTLIDLKRHIDQIVQ